MLRLVLRCLGAQAIGLQMLAGAAGILLCALAVPGQTPGSCQPPAFKVTSQEPNIFTEQQEADLGDAMAEHVQHNFRVIDDDEVTGFLNRIGQRVIKHLPPKQSAISIFSG